MPCPSTCGLAQTRLTCGKNRRAVWRGGLITKLHLAVEQRQKPTSIVVTAGQRGDSPQFEIVLQKVPRATHRAGPAAGPSRPRSR